MRLEFRSEHLSIDGFDPVEMSDFAVITGVNGSGKTHLLRAIRNGSVSAGAIATDDIVLFDLDKFKLQNEAECALKQITEEKHAAWSLFTDEEEQCPYRRLLLERIAYKFFNSEELLAVELVAKKKSMGLLALSKEHFTNDELSKKFGNYKQEVLNLFWSANFQNNHAAQSFLQLLKSACCFPHRITEAEHMEKYETSVLKEGVIPAQLGKIFVEYRVNEFIAAHGGYEHNYRPIRDKLRSLDRASGVRNRYAGAPPWEIINEFLSAYREGMYTITYPQRIPASSIANNTFSFKPQIVNTEKGIRLSYDDLSSGEKVLFMLALCMFKATSESVFPKLLLLDEIDATLHPSMIKNLLSVIRDVLLRKGTKVVLATHSPTTVALVPEECIFVVNPGGPDRIVKVAKNDAIRTLTGGYMTIEDTLKVLDQASGKKICVISEGHNADYIKKAVSLFAKEYEGQICVIDTIKDISSKSQLKIIYEFFVCINPSTPFFVVWDPDCKAKHGNFIAKNNTHPFVLESSPENTLCRSAGIESLFPDSCFESSEIVTISQGGKIRHRAFSPNSKQRFKLRMLANANEESFALFKNLIEQIVSVLEGGSKHAG